MELGLYQLTTDLSLLARHRNEIPRVYPRRRRAVSVFLISLECRPLQFRPNFVRLPTAARVCRSNCSGDLEEKRAGDREFASGRAGQLQSLRMLLSTFERALNAFVAEALQRLSTLPNVVCGRRSAAGGDAGASL